MCDILVRHSLLSCDLLWVIDPEFVTYIPYPIPLPHAH